MLKIFGNETQETISQWAIETFGDVKTTRSILTRANCELAELEHAIECSAAHDKIASEIADVIIVLARYQADFTDASCYNTERPVDRRGFLIQDAVVHLMHARSCSVMNAPTLVIRAVGALHALAIWFDIDLPTAIDAKMAINRGRTWTAKGAGHGQHVTQPALSPEDAETLRLATAFRAARAETDRLLAAYDDVTSDPEVRSAVLARYRESLPALNSARRALLAGASGNPKEGL